MGRYSLCQSQALAVLGRSLFSRETPPPMEHKSAQCKVYLVDGCPMFRAGLRHSLSAEGHLVVVGESGSASDALARVTAAAPDVVLIDSALPDGSGVSVCRRIVARALPSVVVMLSVVDWDVYLAASWAAGAVGFLAKSSTPEAMARALAEAPARPLYSAEQLRRIHAWEQAVGDRLASLADRERDVLPHLAAGLSNHDIAERMVLSVNTVEKHISSIYRKLGVSSRAGLLSFILEHHLEVLTVSAAPQEAARREWWIPVLLSPRNHC